MNGRSCFGKYLEAYTKGVFVMKDIEKPLAEIREHLLKFKGGSVDIEKQDGIAVVTLNHENKRNAMSGQMMVELDDIVQDLQGWPDGKGLLLKGAGGTFCSGGDLNFVRATADSEQGLMMATFMHHLLHTLQTLPLISVALIDGAGALGGGAEITVACDYRLITSSCQGVGFVHPRMGIIPAWGGASRLVQAIGYHRALDVLTTGKVFTPNQCLAIGLVQEVIPDTNSQEYALSWLQERTKYDPQVMRSIKVCAGVARDFPQHTETERRIFAPFWGGPLNMEALKKNIKHRPE